MQKRNAFAKVVKDIQRSLLLTTKDIELVEETKLENLEIDRSSSESDGVPRPEPFEFNIEFT